ncbi:MAG: hypothetical protein JNJ77_11825 [Planctomycetia bacterium]|nr:hypothetical protein [Planctomycetia bacterium]
MNQFGHRDDNLFDFEARHVRFLGPQEGVAETVFTSKIAHLFSKHSIKCRAYLARVDYDDGSGVNIALCIFLGESTDSNLVEELIGITFSNMFNSNEHLDTYMITKERDQELHEMADPFYDNIQ